MNRTRSIFRIGSGIGFALLLASTGCIVPASSLNGSATVAYSEPPPPIQEPQAGQMMNGQIWIQGRHVWVNGQWQWQAGHWEAQRQGYEWQQGSWQRNLQREYVNRLSVILLRGGSVRADTRAAIREQAKSTLAQLKGQRIAIGDKGDAAAWQGNFLP